MLVKMTCIDMTKNGCYYPGQIRKVDDKHGAELIEAKAAIEIKTGPLEKNKKAPESENKSMTAETLKVKELEKLEAEAKRLESEAKDLEKAVDEVEKSKKKEVAAAAKEARKSANKAAEKLEAFKDSIKE